MGPQTSCKNICSSNLVQICSYSAICHSSGQQLEAVWSFLNPCKSLSSWHYFMAVTQYMKLTLLFLCEKHLYESHMSLGHELSYVLQRPPDRHKSANPPCSPRIVKHILQFENDTDIFESARQMYTLAQSATLRDGGSLQSGGFSSSSQTPTL